MSEVSERRKFSRIPFTAEAHLYAAQGEMHLNCQVADISLNGLLILRPIGWLGQTADRYQIDLLLNDGAIVIKMQTQVAHVAETHIGLQCDLIDVDSISHLKRLMELNLGDEALLQREFASLIQAD